MSLHLPGLSAYVERTIAAGRCSLCRSYVRAQSEWAIHGHLAPGCQEGNHRAPADDRPKPAGTLPELHAGLVCEACHGVLWEVAAALRDGRAVVVEGVAP